MRRLRLILAIICPLLLVSCGGSVRDISVTSFNLVSVAPQGTSGVSILIEIGINNPGIGIEITDLQAVLKIDSSPVLVLSSDQLMVDGHKEKVYSVPMKGRIADGANPFKLLKLLGSERVTDPVSLDFEARMALRGGIGKKIEINDIQLDEYLRQKKTETNE